MSTITFTNGFTDIYSVYYLKNIVIKIIIITINNKSYLT